MTSSSRSQNVPHFVGEMIEARKLIPMLKAIQIKQVCVMLITSRGLKITCQEESKCVQATSFIERSLFSKYEMVDEEEALSVCLRINDLLNIITIFMPDAKSTDTRSRALISANQHTLRIEYTQDRDLKLMVSEGSVWTEAQIFTFNCEELMLFNTTFVNKIIISAVGLIDFWKTVDLQSDWIEISINTGPPWISFGTQSERAHCKYDMARDSDDVEQYECQTQVCHRYKLSLLKLSNKALLQATRLSIRTDSEGLLCLQFMIKLDDYHQNCFVEYYIIPEVPPPSQ